MTETTTTSGQKVSLSAILERLSALESRINEGFKRIETQILKVEDDHEQRIRTLEASRWKMAGINAAVALVFAGLPAVIAVIVFLRGG